MEPNEFSIREFKYPYLSKKTQNLLKNDNVAVININIIKYGGLLTRTKLMCFIIVTVLCIVFSSPILSFGLSAMNPSDNNITQPSSVTARNRAQNYHWGTTAVISEPILGGDVNTFTSDRPKVAAEDNKLYVVWEDKTNHKGAGTDTDIFYRYFDGTVWAEIQVISEPLTGKDTNQGESYDPDIAVQNGRIYVVWSDANNTNGAGFEYDIFYRSNLTGSGWEDIQVISEPVPGHDFDTAWSINPSIEVENNEIYLVWQDYNDTDNAGVDWDIFYRQNVTGTSWDALQILSEPVQGQDFNTGGSREPDIEVENGMIYVVWYDDNNTNSAGTDEDIFLRMNLNGQSWAPSQIISEPVAGNDNNVGRSYCPSIAVENDNIYIVWYDNDNTNGAGGDYDIFYRNYNGNSWSVPDIISEPVAGKNFNTGNSQNATIAVENGRLYMVWHDRNNTNGAASDPDIFYRINITGLSWEEVQIISEPIVGMDLNTGTSEYPEIVVTQGKTHVVWMDDNVTNNAGPDKDIFYKCTFVSPTLTQGIVTPCTGYSSTYFNFTVNYTDADNEAPLYIKASVSGINYTMEESNKSDDSFFNGKHYFYNTTLGIGEDYNFNFYCSDGTYNFSTLIIDGPDVQNFKPVILTPDNETAYEDIYYEVRYEFLDIDFGQTHTWYFKSDANWLSFNPTTAILKGTPSYNEVGDAWVNISIQDDHGALNFTNFTVTVIEINDPPIITTIDNLTALEDELYEVTYQASDVDTPLAILVWSIKTDAYWLEFNTNSGILSGTPLNDEVGIYWVNISVNDTEDGSDHTNFTLTVVNVNDQPVILTEDILTASIDELYSTRYEAVDPDPVPITLTWRFQTNAGMWLKLNLTSGWLNGTPSQTDVGKYWVNISVEDGEDGRDFHNFTLTVQPPPNRAPELNTSAVTNTTTADEVFKIGFSAVDDTTPAANLTWKYITNANWLEFDKDTLVLSGIPTDADIGEYWVNISVEDIEGSVSFHNFTVTVKPSENSAPILTGGKIQPNSGDTTTTYTFSVHYYDEDDDPPSSIKVIVDGKEYEMSLESGNVSNGTYIFKNKLTKGVHTFYFTATDGKAIAHAGDTLTPISDSTSRTTSEINEVEGGIDWILILLIVIIIILIMAIIAVVIVRSRKRAVAEAPTTQEPAIEVEKKGKRKAKQKLEFELEEEPIEEEDLDLEAEAEFEFELEEEPEELFEWDEE